MGGDHALRRHAGGFGGSGAPIELIHALIDRFVATGHPRDLTVVNNNAGNAEQGVAALLKAGQVRKIICSFPRQADSYVFDELYRSGKRQNETMVLMAKPLTDQQIEDLAAWYNSITIQIAP